MTRIESTGRPRSQTARTKRSTITRVLPVPAPAETKTTPVASIAAVCSGLVFPALIRRAPKKGIHGGNLVSPMPAPGVPPRSCALHPAHRRELTPRVAASAATRVVADVARADPPDEPAGQFLRPLDLPPERLLVEVVALVEPRHGILASVGAKQPARLPVGPERAVEAADRLDPDQVAQDEQVQRDLEPELGLDLPGRVGGSARLVVLDDPPSAEGVEVDPVDLPRDREVTEIEARLQLRRRAVGAERHFEAPRHERQAELDLVADEAPEVPRQPLVELVTLQPRDVQADALDGPR